MAENPLTQEVKREEHKLERLTQSPWFTRGLIILGVVALVVGLAYLYITSRRVYIENSQIMAPTIVLAPTHAGVLEEMYVRPGQHIATNDFIARISGEVIKAKTDGVIITADPVLGTYFNEGQTVATMYNPADLRVGGRLDEDKGLSSIKIGQQAIFTVDTFGSKQFSGEVQEISAAADNPDVVFSISDQRAEQEFLIKVRYNQNQYPELKPGMSARLWIYK